MSEWITRYYKYKQSIPNETQIHQCSLWHCLAFLTVHKYKNTASDLSIQMKQKYSDPGSRAGLPFESYYSFAGYIWMQRCSVLIHKPTQASTLCNLLWFNPQSSPNEFIEIGNQIRCCQVWAFLQAAWVYFYNLLWSPSKGLKWKMWWPTPHPPCWTFIHLFLELFRDNLLFFHISANSPESLYSCLLPCLFGSVSAWYGL